MLNARQAERAIGVSAGQIILWALTGELPFSTEPESGLMLFDEVSIGIPSAKSQPTEAPRKLDTSREEKN
jgi:hypothetical protein